MNKQQFDTLQQARQIDIANAIKTGQGMTLTVRRH